MYILTYINLGRLDTFNKKIKVNSIPLARCILTKIKYGQPNCPLKNFSSFSY